GQDIWIALMGQLRRFERVNGMNEALLDQLEGQLKEVAADDFALLRSDPPLLYHNDLTATVSRYYWSEAFGYALWLRLYHELERVRGSASQSAMQKSTEEHSRS